MSILLKHKAERLCRIICILFSICLSSCDKESDALLVDVLDEEYQLYDYYIDEYGNEGVVAYIQNGSSISNYPKGYKCVVVLSLDESIEPWGPMGEILMKKDSLSGSELKQRTAGIMMLQSMSSKGIEKYPAQNWCFNKNHSKVIAASSWRLPSYYELQLIFGSSGKNVSAINKYIHNYGGSIIDDSHFYWTCIEDYEGYITINGVTSDYDQANRAVLTSTHNSTWGNKDRWLKKNKYYVRAIKYIYYYDY